MSQEKLAVLAGIAGNTLKKWEAGTSSPTLDNLYAVCNVMGITLEEFFRGRPPESQLDKTVAEAEDLYRDRTKLVTIYEGLPVGGWMSAHPSRMAEIATGLLPDRPGFRHVLIEHDRMNPPLQPGWIAVVDSSRTTPAEGDIVAVEYGGRAFFAFYRRTPGSDRPFLDFANRSYSAIMVKGPMVILGVLAAIMPPIS